MIYKSYQINKINLDDCKFILFYGKNNGAKSDAINELKKKISNKNYTTIDENQILENTELFYNSLISQSLFEEKKNIIINRATDKITKVIEYILEKKIKSFTIISNADLLEKRSKLRTLFERNKEMITVPFYEDTYGDLNKIVTFFIKENKISLSQSNINLIINKCGGDRGDLRNELEKINQFSKNGKKISTETLEKLINLKENHSINELINNCLAKNKKRTLDILNENNYNNEDCVLIARTFLSKSKKILVLSDEYKKNNNIELTISSSKPPIFWKDKEITKQQIFNWEPKKLKELIFQLNELELSIKKNMNNSLNLISDFILQVTLTKSNN